MNLSRLGDTLMEDSCERRDDDCKNATNAARQIARNIAAAGWGRQGFTALPFVRSRLLHRILLDGELGPSRPPTAHAGNVAASQRLSRIRGKSPASEWGLDQ